MSTTITNDEAADTGLSAAADFSRAELAVREQNGLAVTLFWLRGTDVLLVSVVDSWSGDSFELVLAPDDRALDVFHHPYAYAAARGLDTGQGQREWEEEEELVDA
jgi:hypothetical protein